MISPFAVAVVGPIVGAIIGVMAFTGRRIVTNTDSQLAHISQSVEAIAAKVTEIQVELPATFVNREDFFRHIRDEERWQSALQGQISDIKEDIHDIRTHQ